jgi:hypothetical protein
MLALVVDERDLIAYADKSPRLLNISTKHLKTSNLKY